MPKVKFGNRNTYKNGKAIKNVIAYVLKESKTPHGIVGALGASCDSPDAVIRQFKKVKKDFRNIKGKQLMHFWVTFEPEEEMQYTLDQFRAISYQIAAYFGKEYQIVFAVHEDTDNKHIHFAVNTVNFITGKKMDWNKKSFYEFKEFVEDFKLKRYR